MKPYYLYRQKYMAGQQQNVGYATAGNACLYNIDMMEETGSVIAVGAGAISKRVFPDRELRIERAPMLPMFQSISTASKKWRGERSVYFYKEEKT